MTLATQVPCQLGVRCQIFVGARGPLPLKDDPLHPLKVESKERFPCESQRCRRTFFALRIEISLGKVE